MPDRLSFGRITRNSVNDKQKKIVLSNKGFFFVLKLSTCFRCENAAFKENCTNYCGYRLKPGFCPLRSTQQSSSVSQIHARSVLFSCFRLASSKKKEKKEKEDKDIGREELGAFHQPFNK